MASTAIVFALALFSATAKVAGQSNSSNSSNSIEVNDEPLIVDNAYLNPSGSVRCPSRCRTYFAGAAAGDAVICQKQASGVGTAEQNLQNGVACYPAYGCGRDMITCVDQAFAGTLPDTTDHAAACAGLQQVQPENPWECGTAEEGRTPCVNNTPNNAAGKWLKATGDLDCGWGSTYGNTYPGYDGSPTPATNYFNVTGEYDCCLAAMAFENSSWDEGGAALFFQYMATGWGDGMNCRVDREKIIYANMDASSGRSVKYQNTRCGDGKFYYRHAAGAADAANLHTGGRCVVEGGFSRLSELTSGANLPGGELYAGHELPNHNCPQDSETDFSSTCNASMYFNTINDAEDCCEMCRTLSWVPQVGGVVEVEENGTFVNPCVSWQIVEGKCRIIRQAYFDLWNPGMSIKASLTRTSFSPPGNTDWVTASRGCEDSVEKCNYYSFIYYRQFREVAEEPVDSPVFMPNGTNSTGNASYRKVMTQSITPATDNLTFEFNVSSLPSRRDRRSGLVDMNANQTYTNITEETFEEVLNQSNSETMPVETEGAADGTDCGKIEIYDSSSLRTSGDYDIFDEESSPVPICESECVGSGETAQVKCSLQNSTTGSGRRLAEVADKVVVSFTAVGSGYDNVDFGVRASMDALPSAVVETTTGAGETTTTTGPDAGTTSGQNGDSVNSAATATVSMLLVLNSYLML